MQGGYVRPLSGKALERWMDFASNLPGTHIPPDNTPRYMMSVMASGRWWDVKKIPSREIEFGPCGNSTPA